MRLLALGFLLLALGDCKRFAANHELSAGVLPGQPPKAGPPTPAPTSIPGAGSLQRSSVGPVGSTAPCGHPNCTTVPPDFESWFLGTWAILVNGLPGNITFYWDNVRVQGYLFLDTAFVPLTLPPQAYHLILPVNLEEKTSLQKENLQYVVGTQPSWIQWYRPSTKQWFYGILEIVPPFGGARAIHGYAVDPSGNQVRFDAVGDAKDLIKIKGDWEYVLLPVPTGPFTILAGEYAGRLQITQTSSGFTATIQLDTTPLPGGTSRAVEALAEVKVLYLSGGYFITFYHASADRRYYAVMDGPGKTLSGIGVQGSNKFIFTGTRDAVYLAAGGKVASPGILGGWYLLDAGRHKNAGLNLQHTVSGYQAKLNNAALTGVSVVERYSSLFITFFDPSTRLTYYGLFVSDYLGIHGEFIGSSPPVEFAWDAH